ncbi:MAG: hypothetical protein J5980_10090 [Muribaculaceae bacterium]|nr:hypothetical protein [Muribaculaceae bacterium]
MKKLMTITVMLLAVLNMWAGDKLEVPLVEQLTEAERSALPDKTIQMELRQMKWSKKADIRFVEALTSLMRTMCDTDGENYVYAVALDPQPDKTIDVYIQSQDILRGGGDEKTYYGTMQMGRKYFVFLRSLDNELLLKSLLDKGKGKVNFVREYEIVEFKYQPQGAILIANWSDGQMQTMTFEANGENLLSTDEQQQ